MKNNQIQGVKSKKFGPPLWQTMFMMAMGLPEKVDLKNKQHKDAALSLLSYNFLF